MIPSADVQQSLYCEIPKKAADIEIVVIASCEELFHFMRPLPTPPNISPAFTMFAQHGNINLKSQFGTRAPAAMHVDETSLAEECNVMVEFEMFHF